MNTAGAVILVIILLLIAAAIGWIVFTRMRAQRLGLPPPSLSSYIPFRGQSGAPGVQPAPGGVVGWVNDRIRMFKNRNARTAAGAYEQPLGGVGGTGGGAARSGRRGFGPLDPDEAWDTRVGTEADAYGPGGYYEEQELGLAPHGHLHADEDTSYGGASYQMNLAVTPGADDRGRSRSRSPSGLGGAAARGGPNPFDDDAEPSNMSLRGVSPRPLDTAMAASTDPKTGAGASHGAPGESPTERKSIFREDV